MKNKPIGVFDSGVGGLTVLAEIARLLPNEDLVYFGDQGRTPYGPRSKDIIIQFTRQDIAFLMEQDVKFIVSACNTASSVALDVIRHECAIDILGVIDPGARAAAEATTNGKVGIIGTQATIATDAYPKAIHRISNKIKVFSLACPLFVPLAEEGYHDNKATYLIAEDYLHTLRDNGIDTLVLGCTHYPLLKKAIQNVIGDSVRIIDSATSTAIEVKQHLADKDLLKSSSNSRRSKPLPGALSEAKGAGSERSEEGFDKFAAKGTQRFYVSDVPDRFAPIAERFLGHRLDQIIRVDITKY